MGGGGTEEIATPGLAGQPRYTARLLVSCPDRPGIVAAVSGLLFGLGANIVSSHQYSSDPSGGRFFLRTEFFLPDAVTPSEVRERFGRELEERFEMEWEIREWGEHRRVAILVSRHEHCLLDLLWRRRRGELEGEIVCVISNHPDLGDEVRAAGIEFLHVPVSADTRAESERAILDRLAGQADLLVLARYMQILSGAFLEQAGMPAINIHHSFLPAFPGSSPYRRAHERGVKLIGATAHYVTEELDDGPIIDQDVIRVDHRAGPLELERVGRDVERMVLSRAVALHLEDRVIVDGRRTVVF
jgi:formyltetrahydrofolate deformylase